MSSDPPDTNFHVITALRYDPLLLTSEENSRPELNFVSPSPFYMLRYHRDRLSEAAQHFEFDTVVKFLNDGEAFHKTLLHEVQKLKEIGGQDEALKVRVLFNKIGKLSVELTVVPPVPLSSLFPSTFDRPKSSVPHPAHAATLKTSSLTGGALTLGDTDSLPAVSQDDNDSTNWLLRLDKAATPSSPFTLLKTTVREIYNSSRTRALPTNPTAPTHVEVILYNECDELTEGSITSLYVYRGGRWVTPPVGVPAGQFDALTLKGEEGDRWDEGELRQTFAGRWGHSMRSSKVGAGGQRGTTRRWALSKGMCMEEPISVDTVSVGEGVWVSNGVIGFGFGRVID